MEILPAMLTSCGIITLMYLSTHTPSRHHPSKADIALTSLRSRIIANSAARSISRRKIGLCISRGARLHSSPSSCLNSRLRLTLRLIYVDSRLPQRHLQSWHCGVAVAGMAVYWRWSSLLGRRLDHTARGASCGG